MDRGKTVYPPPPSGSGGIIIDNQESHATLGTTHRMKTNNTKITNHKSIVAEKNVTKNGHIQNVCSMCIKINKAGKQEVGI
jgi:hypothetical protein